MRIAVVTDSNSGITQVEAKRLGIYVIPMPFMINGKDYLEEVNLSHEEFYELLCNGAEVLTSQPPIGAILNMWNELLENYDQIIHIPMSSSLSQSCSTALLLANDYPNKVFVVDNQRISITQRQSVLDAIELIDRGLDGESVKKELEDKKLDSSIYITVETLKYLRRGGRVTAAGAALGALLKIKPVLEIQGGKLDAFAKSRGMKSAKRIMLEALRDDIEVRFGGVENVHLCVIYARDIESANEYVLEVQNEFPDTEIYLAPLPLSIACHIGPGALAVACSKKI